ncbi:hypothetical protein CROQUDRAFT_101784 [Cronartium quercuum f. sp. fusiforme G11]|uniref:Uncharacterized protein n=1 Tax=Cronartium quercuum f. sp. fusiforme G11 TaxID=708437 RepID=A0A9P6N7V0_9BASI|nr:hypothetical protein CROQUDRAFT_101784 [Cronartium quercuum f. sp. fusiforme G11]
MTELTEKERHLSPYPSALKIQNEEPFEIRKIEIYRHPLTQIAIVSIICFCCPGIFNSLSGLGGGGQVDATTADNGKL